MARGWESKSVELQRDIAPSNREARGKRQLTPEMISTLRQKETLLLACAHTKQQMQASQHPRHRVMLQNALADLEKQLANLNARERAAGSF
jgi:archaeosine-15-forming tRNA-guanine transglycosylase